jgi:NAD(P)-dependent dehydrogenase (short-subunit alcohol dehydrogenase family)
MVKSFVLLSLIADIKAGSYAASKAAVTNLTRQVALDYAVDGIHCNSISPGCKSPGIEMAVLTTAGV